MSQARKTLLKGGTILQHTENDEVKALYDTDLLIAGDSISRIGQDLEVDFDTLTIDCRDKIVSPGFVDTHHHVWQTQLKGRHSDDTLLDYHPKGQSAYHTLHLPRHLADFAKGTFSTSTTHQRTSSGASWEDCLRQSTAAQRLLLIMHI